LWRHYVTNVRDICIRSARLELERYDHDRSEYENRKRKRPDWKRRDKVLWWSGPKMSAGKMMGTLHNKWKGPYRIVKVFNDGQSYRIQLDRDSAPFNVDIGSLRIYRERDQDRLSEQIKEVQRKREENEVDNMSEDDDDRGSDDDQDLHIPDSGNQPNIPDDHSSTDDYAADKPDDDEQPVFSDKDKDPDTAFNDGDDGDEQKDDQQEDAQVFPRRRPKRRRKVWSSQTDQIPRMSAFPQRKKKRRRVSRNEQNAQQSNDQPDPVQRDNVDKYAAGNVRGFRLAPSHEHLLVYGNPWDVPGRNRDPTGYICDGCEVILKGNVWSCNEGCNFDLCDRCLQEHMERDTDDSKQGDDQDKPDKDDGPDENRDRDDKKSDKEPPAQDQEDSGALVDAVDDGHAGSGQADQSGDGAANKQSNGTMTSENEEDVDLDPALFDAVESFLDNESSNDPALDTSPPTMSEFYNQKVAALAVDQPTAERVKPSTNSSGTVDDGGHAVSESKEQSADNDGNSVNDASKTDAVRERQASSAQDVDSLNRTHRGAAGPIDRGVHSTDDPDGRKQTELKEDDLGDEFQDVLSRIAAQAGFDFDSNRTSQKADRGHQVGRTARDRGASKSVIKTGNANRKGAARRSQKDPRGSSTDNTKTTSRRKESGRKRKYDETTPLPQSFIDSIQKAVDEGRLSIGGTDLKRTNPPTNTLDGPVHKLQKQYLLRVIERRVIEDLNELYHLKGLKEQRGSSRHSKR